jgi:hypothetical protein
MAATFGAANVRSQAVDGPEGSTLQATLVYPDNPRKRLKVLWWDESGRKRPSAITVDGNPSDWRIAGLTVGSSLEDLAAANGKRFSISGFGWDYGGRVTDWRGGKLAAAKGCTLQVALSPPPGAPQPAKIMGDVVGLGSRDKAVVAARPVVVEIGIGYPDE